MHFLYPQKEVKKLMQLDVIWSCLMGMYSFVLGAELGLNWCCTVDKEYWHLEKGEAGKGFTLDLKHKPRLKVRVLRLIKWHAQRLGGEPPEN